MGVALRGWRLGTNGWIGQQDCVEAVGGEVKAGSVNGSQSGTGGAQSIRIFFFPPHVLNKGSQLMILKKCFLEGLGKLGF